MAKRTDYAVVIRRVLRGLLRRKYKVNTAVALYVISDMVMGAFVDLIEKQTPDNERILYHCRRSVDNAFRMERMLTSKIRKQDK
jgi:hypothetical protein